MIMKVYRFLSWKNLSKVQRLLVVQYIKSSCSYFKIDSPTIREPVQADQRLDVTFVQYLTHWVWSGTLAVWHSGWSA